MKKKKVTYSESDDPRILTASYRARPRLDPADASGVSVARRLHGQKPGQSPPGLSGFSKTDTALFIVAIASALLTPIGFALLLKFGQGL